MINVLFSYPADVFDVLSVMSMIEKKQSIESL